MIILDDEIHCDFVYAPHHFTSFLTLDEKYRNNLVVFNSPSKTFNVPGLGSSYVICQNPDLFAKYPDYVSDRALAEENDIAYN